MFHPFPHATACFLAFSSKIGPHPPCKDDVIQRKQKSGKTVKAIIKPKHQLAKQRRSITGSYTEGKPKIRPARSVTEEQNNRSCDPTNTPNPDNNKSYRLQRPVKMALWKSDQITASEVNCHKFFSFCFRDIVDNVDDFPCRLCCFLSRYHCHCNLFGKESERKKVFGQNTPSTLWNYCPNVSMLSAWNFISTELDHMKSNEMLVFEISENNACSFARFERAFFIFVNFAAVHVLLCSCVDNERTWRHLSIFSYISKPLMPI